MPFSNPPSSAPTQRARTPDATTPVVLLVEDDDADAFLVTELLDVAGSDWVVRRARSIAEVTGGGHGRVDCVLLDLGLPDATGLDALTAVLASVDDAAVVCLTGLADERRGAEAVAAGAQDYLVKGSVDGDRLVRAMRYAMERRRADETSRQLYASRLQAAENARLERGLLPTPRTRDERLLVTTRYRAGRGSLLGGDFFDAVEREDGTLLVVVGDVAGHGPDEAALGVCLRIAWRALVLSGAPVESLMPNLEAVLDAERRHERVYTTACMVVVSPERDRADLWLAGHHAPLVLGPTGRWAQVPVTDRHPALGLLEGGTWDSQTVPLHPGWRLVLFTDGWIEARVDGGSQRLGVAGLLDLMASHGPLDTSDLLDGVLAQVLAGNGGALQDDVAVVALECRPPSTGGH